MLTTSTQPQTFSTPTKSGIWMIASGIRQLWPRSKPPTIIWRLSSISLLAIVAVAMGHFAISDLLVLQAIIGSLIFMDKITKFLAIAQAEVIKRTANGGALFISYFLPGFQHKSQLLFGVPQPPQEATAGNSNNNPHQNLADDVKIRVNRNCLTVELLDGGLCLDVEDDIIVCEESPIHRAVEAAVAQSPCTIEKLDLCASVMRADLNAKMVHFLLQKLPDLLYLNLGGVSLSVQDLTVILRYPSLKSLDSITLCDVEFLATDNPMETNATEESLLRTTAESLALRKVVCLFTRVEEGVTLDPLLESLQKAPRLERFELVMDHNHAYNHGQPRQQRMPANSIFSDTCLGNVLQAARHLRILILEYVPLNTAHLNAMAKSLSLSCNSELKDIRLVDDQYDDLIGKREWTAMAHFLEKQSSLQTLSLDGVTRESHDTSLILQGLVHNVSIEDLRLRNLPIDVDSLRTYLSSNKKLQNLFLHGNSYAKVKDQGFVLSVLVEVLKEHNCTLQRISFKQGKCARTEVFPRRRKIKTYRCYTQHLFSLTNDATWTIQQQLHWYLMLNQRGIRHIMLDVGQTTTEFLQVLLNQQEKDDAHGSDDYDLDCLYYLISNNPSLCTPTAVR